MRYLAMILAAAGMLWCATATRAEEPKKISVLVLTGTDVSAHNWKDNSKCLNEILDGSGKFAVTMVEELKTLDSAEDLGKFDAVVLHGSFNGGKWEISDAGKKNLLEYVKGGKGFYAQHYATASWQKWADFTELCGRRWVNGKSGHNARAPFDAKITATDHPITAGLKDFRADDELYAKLQGKGEVSILVAAESDFSKVNEPLVFVHDYGKGRVVINNFGHDRKAMETPAETTLILRSIEWAATGKVTEAAK